jgi:hypothetical protein
MPQPPTNSDPEDPAPNPQKLTKLSTAIKIPQTVPSVAGRLAQFNRKVQENPDSIKRRTNSRGACKQVESCQAAREIFYGG